ncbi:MAG TPA: hypothetical protein DCR11_09530 [Deltaproteobacteria bacterium]|nr:hypothetical protein [Deltaproteobacteria bacterium]
MQISRLGEILKTLITENLTVFVLTFVSVGLGIAFLLSPYGTVALYIALVIMLLVIIKPIYGLYAVIPIIPVRTFNMLVPNPNRTQSEKYSMGSLLVFLVYIALSFNLFATRASSRHKVHIDVLVLLFLMWSLTTLFWTHDIYHGSYVFFELLTGILIMYIFQRTIRSEADLLKVYKYLAFAALLWGTLMFISQWYNGTVFNVQIFNKVSVMFDVYIQERRVGGFAPPQTSSNTLAVAMFLVFSLFYTVRPLGKFIIVLLCLFMIDNVLLGGSKGAVGALLLGMIATVVLSPKMRKNAFVWIFSIFSSFAVVYLFNVVAFSEQRLTASSKVSEASLTYRLQFWEKGFETLSHNGWIGDGIGGFARYVDPWPGAHSFYFSILFDLGIIGLLIFMLMLAVRASALTKAIMVCKSEFLSHALYCMVGAFLTFLVHGIVEMEYSFLHFWMLIGLLERVTVFARADTHV